MTQKIQFLADDQIRWPKRCAKCGETDGLITSKIRISAIDRSSQWLVVIIVIRIRSMMLEIPFCRRHHALASITDSVIGCHPFKKFVRSLIYAIFLLTITAIPARFQRLHEVPTLNFFNWGVAGWLSFTGIAGLAAIAWSRKWAPVRISKWDDAGIVDIVFDDPEYAREFNRLNPVQTDPQATSRTPWYKQKYYRDAILFTVVLVGGLLIVAYSGLH